MTAGARHSLMIAGTRLELSPAGAAEPEAHLDLPAGNPRVQAERDFERELELGDAVRAALTRAERGGVASVELAVAPQGAFEQSADVIVGTIRAFLSPGSKLKRVVLRVEDGVMLETLAGELDRHRRDLERELST